MSIIRLLHEHRDTIIKKWCDAIFATYPIDTAGFLRSHEDRFTNPVGDKTRRAVEMMVDAISGYTMPEGEPEKALAELMKIRAVQSFSPEVALGVLFAVKPILRDTVLEAVKQQNLVPQYLDVESRVDTLALIAFRYYSDDREQLHMLRVEEYKRRYAQLFRRAKLILEEPVGEPDQSQPKA